MKKTLKLVALLVVLCMVLAVGLTACTDPDNTPDVRETMDLDDYKAYIKADLATAKAAIGTVSDSVDAAVLAAYNSGIASIEAAKNTTAVQNAFKAAKSAMANCVPYANGIYNFAGMSIAEKEEALGVLENYAIRTGLTGTTLFNEGGYVKYHERVKLGTETYIPGYGFGTLEAGELTAPLTTELTEKWQMYYHSAASSDPGTLNYLNDQGSQVSGLYGYIAASYYTIFMNSTGDGYEWVPELAASDPEAVSELDSLDQATTWRFELRRDLKYSTLGSRTSYNNRPVELEDYITPFKLLLNKANGYFRGSEMASNVDSTSIRGIENYYRLSFAKGIPEDTDEIKFSDIVGIKVYKENEGQSGEKWWFEFELNAPASMFFARYYVNSSLTMPIPKAFIDEVGVDNYLAFNGDKTESPVDNSLALGAYVAEQWDSNQQTVFKKNPNYVYASTKYKIAGVHINIYPGASEDEELIWNEFVAGNLDAAGIPSTQFAQHRYDEGVRITVGGNFKLNMNALDAETWEELFGVNGKVTQTPANKYWDVKPVMSNAHFRSALSYAIDRVSFADALNCTPAIDFFDPEYQSDPENGITYNSTQSHLNAVANLVRGTDGYGYSKQLAQEYFRMALDELEASGQLTPGTKSNPKVIELEVAWMYTWMEETYHNFVKQCWEDTFNDETVTGGLYKLKINFWVGNKWSDVYYQKMMVGQFDIGFGSISGGTYSPLNFIGNLSADPVISGGFTLNWGTDTNDPDAEILVFKGMRWSFDALYQATQKTAIVDNGRLSDQFTVAPAEPVVGDDTVTFTFTISWANGVEINFDEIDFVVFGYSGNGSDYDEWSILDYLVGGAPVIDNAKRTATFTFAVDKSELGDLMYKETFGIDLYIGWTFQGEVNATDFFTSYYFDFSGDAA